MEKSHLEGLHRSLLCRHPFHVYLFYVLVWLHLVLVAGFRIKCPDQVLNLGPCIGSIES